MTERASTSRLPDPETWLSTRQAAQVVGVSYETFLRYVREGRVTGHRAYPGARWRVRLADAQELAERSA